jgi:lipoprotein-anchoring transpeptidase ErfK/SrfK
MTVETIEAPSSSESAVDRSAGAVTETEAETEAAVETETSGETETETPVGVDTADTTLSETPEGPIDGTVSETDATTWVPPETPDSPAPAQSEHTVTADTATMASQTVVESTGESDSAATLASAVTPADATLTPMTTPPGGVGPSDSARPRHRVRLFVLIGLGLVVVLSGVAAVFLAQHFDQRVKPGVTALGHDVAGMTDSELVAALTEWTAALTVPVTDGDQSRDIPIADLGISFDVNQLAAAALAEGRSWRPWRTYNPWWTKPAPADLTIDQTMLQDHLDDAFIPLDAQTVEAAPVFDPAVGGFVVQPSRTGEHADIAPVLAALDAYAAGQADLSRVLVPVKIDPPLFGDAAAAAAASQANQWTERQIVLDNGFSGYSRKTYQLTPAEIAQWVEITPIPDGTYAVSFDSAQAVTDLEPILNQQVATPMKPTVAVLDPDNPTEILGYEWGEAGSRVVDPAAVIGTIESALAGGQQQTYTVPLDEEPATEIAQLPPPNFDEPTGAKWIDVNKSTYTATAYEGTTQVNQFIISIGRGGVYETSDGSFYIYLKYANQVMRGGTGTVEGRYEYATPVTWVSYFNRDIAFHEADWNSAQGTWAARVSHGCVNMPGSAARWIYNWAPIGTKVVVHY